MSPFVRVPLVCALALAAACAPTTPPQLALNHDRLDFGAVEVGGAYQLGLVLMNPGTQVLPVTDVRLDPPLPELELQGLPVTQIDPESREVLTVIYRPTADGPLDARLHLEALGAYDVPLTGTAHTLDAVARSGGGASCAGQSNSIDFGLVVSGLPGARSLVVESTGTAPITLRKARVSPEDAGVALEGLTPNLTLAPGQTALLSLRVDPRVPGPVQGVVTVETDSFRVPRLEVPFCLDGRVALLCAQPSALAFGDVAVGATATRRLTVSSCGNLPVTLQDATVVPDPSAAPGFTLPTPLTAPLPLAPSASTTLDVQFDATLARAARSTVRLTSSSPVTPEVLVPTGANLPPPCTATLTPDTLRFYAGLGTWQPVQLTNSGATDCRIDRLEVVPANAPFALERQLDLPAVLPARSSMEFRLHYAPLSGASTAKLEVELDWVHEVALLGEPTPPPGCHLVGWQPSLDFGLIARAGTVTRPYQLSNLGAGPCTIAGVSFDKPGFSGMASSSSVPPQSAVSVVVSYAAPAGSTLANAVMTITSNDVDHPQLAVPVITGRVRCDPNCRCTAQQTPTYWRFSDPSSSVSAVQVADGGLGAFQESCDPLRCPVGAVAVEVDRGRLDCASPPPTCPAGTGLEYLGDGWTCVPCALIVQYGGLYAGQRACAPVPTLSCGSGTVPTFDATDKRWRCVATCNNGAYDQRQLADGTLVCIPC